MRKALLCLALSLPLLGQNAAMLPDPHIRFTDSAGRPLALGKIYTCVAGTSCPGNPLATYTDSTAVTQNANPIILDAGGYASVWIGTGTYKLVAQNALGAQQWTQDNVTNNGFAVGQNVTALKCVANGLACLDGSAFVLQSELNYTQGATGSVNRTIQSKLQERVSVKDFGAVGNGTADDTSAINAAITALGGSGGTVIFPVGTYKTTSTITLPTGVNLIAFDNAMLDQGGHSVITGSFAGFLFEINATQGNLIQGLTLTSTYWGGTQGTAGGIRIDGIAGMITLRDVKVNFKDTGFYGAPSSQLISSVLENVYFAGDSGSNGLSRCISTYGRGSRILGGRAYACHIGYDISGDDWKLDGVDGEFNDIAIRTGAVAGLLVMGSHFETSGMLWTNAITLPTTTTYPWTDNGGNGTGWSGTIRFLNNIVFFNAHGTANPQNAPLFVVKSQPSMAGRLVLDGNVYAIGGTSISPNFFSLSSNFAYTTTPALVTGVQVISYDTLNIPTIPTDSFTAWLDLSSYGINSFGGFGGNITLQSGNQTLTNGSITLTNGNLTATAGNVTVGGNVTTGAAKLLPMYHASATLGGSALTAGQCSSANVTPSGATAAHPIDATATVVVSGNYYDQGSNYLAHGTVHQNGPSVDVYVCAVTAGTPASNLYNITVFPSN